MQTAKTTTQTVAKTHRRIAEPLNLRKRIGPTVYEVGVHFSQASQETMNDKILRLVRRDAEAGK